MSMRFRALPCGVAAFFLAPAIVVAADTPWSVELDTGTGTARDWSNRGDLDIPAGGRVIVTEKTTIRQALFGSVGGIVRYRLQDHIDAFARVDWQDSRDLDEEIQAAFSNGSQASFTSNTLQEVQQTWLSTGLRWTQPLASGLAAEASADLRHLDHVAYDTYPALPPFFTGGTRKSKEHDYGSGLELGLRWQFARTCSLLLDGGYAHTGDIAATTYGLSLDWRVF